MPRLIPPVSTIINKDFLRFLWYEGNDFTKAIIKNKMTRLSFGLLPAQSAALYCLEQTIFDNPMQASVTTIVAALKNFDLKKL